MSYSVRVKSLYCPNCNINLGPVEVDACPNCRAVFGEGAAWQPVSEPSGPVRRVKGARAEDGEPAYFVALSLLYTLLLWTGHFLLVGVPLLFVLYHVAFRPTGSSGVGLGFSIVASIVPYTLAALVSGVRALTPYAGVLRAREIDQKATVSKAGSRTP